MAKKTPQRKLEQQRRLRAKVRTRSASMQGNPTDDSAPPPEAVAAYLEVFEWAADNPEESADLACLHETDWTGPMAGMAFPELYDIPEDERLHIAWQFRAWHILNQLKFTLDWSRPISVMSDQEILDQLRQDGKDGKITRKSYFS